MMYPFMTLNDDTEITHSEMKADGSVKVYIETPDEVGGFHNATCWLPAYKWENIEGYSDTEISYFKQLIRKNAHLIIEFSQEGGVLNAATSQNWTIQYLFFISFHKFPILCINLYLYQIASCFIINSNQVFIYTNEWGGKMKKRIGIYHYQYYRGACKLCYRHFIQEMVESYEKCHEVAEEL